MDFHVSNSQLGAEHISAARLNAKVQTGKCLPSRGARKPGWVGGMGVGSIQGAHGTSSSTRPTGSSAICSSWVWKGKHTVKPQENVLGFFCRKWPISVVLQHPSILREKPSSAEGPGCPIPGTPAVIRCLDLGQGLKGHLAPELFIHFYLSTGRAEHSAPSPAWAQGKIPACARSFFMA